MDTHERESPWIKRIEELVDALDGSTVGELELREGGTEIIIRRSPHMLLVSSPTQQVSFTQTVTPGAAQPSAPREEKSKPVTTPLTGVYYSSPSPTSPPFVNIGDLVQAGQVIALIEAMKVFNEIQSEVSGRVVALVAKNGDVVQKGSTLLKVEPL